MILEGRSKINRKYLYSRSPSYVWSGYLFIPEKGKYQFDNGIHCIRPLKNKIHHDHHYDEEQYGHDSTCLHKISNPVTRRPHDQGIDLVRRNQE